MATNKYNRRSFLKGSASVAALMSLPVPGFSQTTLSTRVEWQVFKTTPQYASFLNAVKLMKAETDSTKPTSWTYWANVHLNYCPHMQPYFFAWHRGYLYYFEQQLRIVSGDSALTLPYWDYYTYPNMPSEFTDAASGNPLYVSGRVNTNVYAALTLAPFSSSIVNMQRGTSNSYEASFESAPHNPVHNIIGGWMADMSSPIDPIFYLHHANVDRLWDAWCLEPPTIVPAPNSSYWSGSFTYATNLTIARSRCYRPESLNYQYAKPNNVPTRLPQSAQVGRIIRVQAQLAPILTRPPIGNFPNMAARSVSNNRRSLGGVANVRLNEASVSARLTLQEASTTTFKYPHLVLDKLAVTALGRNGGYYYNIYLNLPASGDADVARASHFIGTFGAFEASGAIHHNGSTLMLPLADVLQNLGVTNLSEAVISLVRVNGPNSPKGDVLSVGEMRVERSTDGP
ncbi:tyrosinase family protein [Paraburkholderia sp. LEh10]|uniref:tyrosinase family protein n=1 Tax=Paraburkholderia sp. LEh10 TaxID=2821353 RepID=UPI001AE6C572|nr:tyrosinase family protein [Paraburkholderia sp. LEh10]MBP0588183.1 tyrosinase family protein [Paraburkholderia sp. LEh10]